MKVYYDHSIKTNGHGFWGLIQKTNWQFEHLENKRFIPAIYRFSKGIVFDIVSILEEEKLRDYFEKYKSKERELTDLERRCAEDEHPFRSIPIWKIWINGKKVKEGYSSSSIICIPWLPGEDQLTEVRKAYSSIIKDNRAFACERYCMPYPEADSKVDELLQFLRLKRINSLKIFTSPVHRFLPLDIQFEILPKEEYKEITFNHPITGINHTLYFQKPEPVELPMGKDKANKIYTTKLLYQVDPPLPKGDTLRFKNSVQYREDNTTKNEFSPTAASSIGIIGGATGSTANYGCCFAVPSFQKKDTSFFHIEGIDIKMTDSKEYNFI